MCMPVRMRTRERQGEMGRGEGKEDWREKKKWIQVEENIFLVSTTNSDKFPNLKCTRCTNVTFLKSTFSLCFFEMFDKVQPYNTNFRSCAKELYYETAKNSF